MKSILGILFASVLLSSIGCGEGSGACPVTGRVVLPGDIPLVNATVTFKSNERNSQARPRGQTDENGQFELRLNEKSKGALPGNYLVTINEAGGDDIDTQLPPTIHARYSNFEKSGLQFTVEPGSNHFDILVDPPQANKR